MMRILQSDEDLFAAALALPRRERSRFLERACGEDAATHDRLRALLDTYERAAHFIDTAASRPFEATGNEIGNYRLLRALGEGGCGVVYLAERKTACRSQVALKIIKPGMDARALVARFAAEPQAQALMDHDNIAKVFQVGATPDGRPYFVMELVRGLKITEYCDASRLSIPERLVLFVQLCHAIEHAHGKGIVHRDIKPSNVLVTLEDGIPIVKVIDFGIAEAITPGWMEPAPATEHDQFVGTPAYVSPEQTQPTRTGIDTRSDIYSLGALLYELLTGCSPFEAEWSGPQQLQELLRRIREDVPLRPSARVAALTALQSMAAVCCGDHARLIAQLRGTLERIVMRCLKKQPEARYQSVTVLRAAVQRYLRSQCMPARPAAAARCPSRRKARQTEMLA